MLQGGFFLLHMQYKPISLPPEDSQFLSTREFGVEEICRIFRVPPHMVQDLKRATVSNIEHQSIDFVVHTLDPWLVRIEKAIVKDLLMEDEKDLFFPKFNVDGLLRGDYKSRMDGYSIGISTGIISPNEARRKENMPPLPDEEGGDFHIVNGTFIKLKDVGQQYGVQDEAKPETPEEQEPEEEQPEKEEEQHENKRHTERHEERKSERRGKGGYV
ncbi:MAG: phage portal protein [Clostridia bacterium]|nr:phage portal protein [Clostridia bacterium]